MFTYGVYSVRLDIMDDIENDRNDSKNWMSQFIESEQQKVLQDMEELQTKLKHLNDKLLYDAYANIEITKRNIRTTQFTPLKIYTFSHLKRPFYIKFI